MTEEQKDILLKDLCARLPYGVKMNHIADDEVSGETLIGIAKDMITLQGLGGYSCVPVEHYKPYLIPLSSMSEEQKKELFNLCEFYVQEDGEGKKSEVYGIEIARRPDPVYCYDHTFRIWGIDMRAINWLLKNHFDIYGLIPMGLVNDATGLNVY